MGQENNGSIYTIQITAESAPAQQAVKATSDDLKTLGDVAAASGAQVHEMSESIDAGTASTDKLGSDLEETTDQTKEAAEAQADLGDAAEDTSRTLDSAAEETHNYDNTLRDHASAAREAGEASREAGTGLDGGLHGLRESLSPIHEMERDWSRTVMSLMAFKEAWDTGWEGGTKIGVAFGWIPDVQKQLAELDATYTVFRSHVDAQIQRNMGIQSDMVQKGLKSADEALKNPLDITKTDAAENTVSSDLNWVRKSLDANRRTQSSVESDYTKNEVASKDESLSEKDRKHADQTAKEDEAKLKQLQSDIAKLEAMERQQEEKLRALNDQSMSQQAYGSGATREATIDDRLNADANTPLQPSDPDYNYWKTQEYERKKAAQQPPADTQQSQPQPPQAPTPPPDQQQDDATKQSLDKASETGQQATEALQDFAKAHQDNQQKQLSLLDGITTYSSNVLAKLESLNGTVADLQKRLGAIGA